MPYEENNKKYNEYQMVDLLLNNIPGFADFFDRELGNTYKTGTTASYCMGLGKFFMEKNKNFTDNFKKNLFTLAEDLIVNGNDIVGTLICTCFLENIVNYSCYEHNKEKIDFKDFIPYLGHESKGYLKAYDKLFGTITPGLYDE